MTLTHCVYNAAGVYSRNRLANVPHCKVDVEDHVVIV